jgi:hypothetical protein
MRWRKNEGGWRKKTENDGKIGKVETKHQICRYFDFSFFFFERRSLTFTFLMKQHQTRNDFSFF